MTSPQCRRYDTCNAPLCPMDEHSLKHCIWYPDEDICSLRANSSILWIQNQKKIKKKAGRVDRYFTFEMLNRDFTIRKGIEGLDPDQSEQYQLKRWLKEHPEKKELSEDEKQIMAQRMEKVRKSKGKQKKHKHLDAPPSLSEVVEAGG